MTGPAGPPVVIDGGDRSCVQLLIQLREHVTRLLPGTVIYLIATDPAAPLDLAAWCHLTGHTYLGPLDAPADPRPAYAVCVGAAVRATEKANPWRPER